MASEVASSTSTAAAGGGGGGGGADAVTMSTSDSRSVILPYWMPLTSWSYLHFRCSNCYMYVSEQKAQESSVHMTLCSQADKLRLHTV